MPIFANFKLKKCKNIQNNIQAEVYKIINSVNDTSSQEILISTDDYLSMFFIPNNNTAGYGILSNISAFKKLA